MQILIRDAVDKDLPAIVDIFNQGIRSRTSTGFLEEVTVQQRDAWFHEHSKTTYPLLVAEHQNKVIGWISIDPYRKGRNAFIKTVEVSLFVHLQYKRKGVGTDLLHAMIATAKKLEYRIIIAIILEKNKDSIRLFEKNNFERWGFLLDVAEIDGNHVHHVYYGRTLQRISKKNK